VRSASTAAACSAACGGVIISKRSSTSRKEEEVTEVLYEEGWGWAWFTTTHRPLCLGATWNAASMVGWEGAYYINGRCSGPRMHRDHSTHHTTPHLFMKLPHPLQHVGVCTGRILHMCAQQPAGHGADVAQPSRVGGAEGCQVGGRLWRRRTARATGYVCIKVLRWSVSVRGVGGSVMTHRAAAA
jgi:hypothetical protein